MGALDSIVLSLQSLVIFRSLLDDEAVVNLCGLCGSMSVQDRLSRYARLVAALYRREGDLGRYILQLVLEDENVYVQRRANNLTIDAHLEECLEHELRLLEELSRLSAKELHAYIGFEGYLPNYTNTKYDFQSAYRQRMENLFSTGYGMYANHTMFRLEGAAIVPVLHSDTTRLSDLKGYELERKAVIDNALALIKGKPAANALLYGDAGTGKSSTVKAIVNEYKDQGLRLIQVLPSQFSRIPALMEHLIDNPLKFILFIDDLSFAEQNDEFTALKAILEGSVVHKASNVSIHATSNRMHLVKELFSQREGDDIHRSETVAELTSLSERFGLCVGFYKPDKAQYLRIVHQLKEQYGISMNDVMLDLQAEQFALSRGGRSPRAARQFMDHLLSME